MLLFRDQAMDTAMHTVQISDELKDILNRLVADGAAATEADFVEHAVRRCAEELDDGEADLVAAAKAGLADICAGNFVAIDGPDAHQAFWDSIRREVGEKVAEMRASAVPVEAAPKQTR
jgi:predicted transcriptional regulator